MLWEIKMVAFLILALAAVIWKADCQLCDGTIFINPLRPPFAAESSPTSETAPSGSSSPSDGLLLARNNLSKSLSSPYYGSYKSQSKPLDSPSFLIYNGPVFPESSKFASDLSPAFFPPNNFDVPSLDTIVTNSPSCSSSMPISLNYDSKGSLDNSKISPILEQKTRFSPSVTHSVSSSNFNIRPSYNVLKQTPQEPDFVPKATSLNQPFYSPNFQTNVISTPNPISTLIIENCFAKSLADSLQLMIMDDEYESTLDYNRYPSNSASAMETLPSRSEICANSEIDSSVSSTYKNSCNDLTPNSLSTVSLRPKLGSPYYWGSQNNLFSTIKPPISEIGTSDEPNIPSTWNWNVIPDLLQAEANVPDVINCFNNPTNAVTPNTYGGLNNLVSTSQNIAPFSQSSLSLAEASSLLATDSVMEQTIASSPNILTCPSVINPLLTPLASPITSPQFSESRAEAINSVSSGLEQVESIVSSDLTSYLPNTITLPEAVQHTAPLTIPTCFDSNTPFSTYVYIPEISISISPSASQSSFANAETKNSISNSYAASQSTNAATIISAAAEILVPTVVLSNTVGPTTSLIAVADSMSPVNNVFASDISSAPTINQDYVPITCSPTVGNMSPTTSSSSIAISENTSPAPVVADIPATLEVSPIALEVQIPSSLGCSVNPPSFGRVSSRPVSSPLYELYLPSYLGAQFSCSLG